MSSRNLLWRDRDRVIFARLGAVRAMDHPVRVSRETSYGKTVQRNNFQHELLITGDWLFSDQDLMSMIRVRTWRDSGEDRVWFEFTRTKRRASLIFTCEASSGRGCS